MLVLSRKLREKIQIATADGPITVAIIRINDRVVRVGIEAPQHCQIMREELLAQEHAARTESPQAA